MSEKFSIPPRPRIEPRKLGVYKKFSREKLEAALDDANEQLNELSNRNDARDSADNRNNDLPEIIDAASFIALPLKSPPELVKGIFHTGSKLAFGGGSKSHKTWCLLDLALSVATGTEFLGFRTTGGKVLFVNFEIQPHAWQHRISSVAHAKGIKITPGIVHLLNLRGHAADFRALIPKIIECCPAEKFALIVLDPIYKLYGNADENKAGDIAALLNEIERLAVESGAAVAFGAHFAKGNAAGKEAIDRISGSGVFARDPDSLLIFTKHEDEDCFVVEPILRNFPPVAAFAVRWEFPLMERDDDLDPARLKQTGGRKRNHTEEQLLEVLGNKSLAATEWQRLAGKEQGISRRTFYSLKKNLEKSERIIKSKNDKWKQT